MAVEEFPLAVVKYEHERDGEAVVECAAILQCDRGGTIGGEQRHAGRKQADVRIFKTAIESGDALGALPNGRHGLRAGLEKFPVLNDAGFAGIDDAREERVCVQPVGGAGQPGVGFEHRLHDGLVTGSRGGW